VASTCRRCWSHATQSSLNGLPAPATAGVITTRAAAQAFFIAGTNRAMFRFTLMNHMCRDLEQVMDTTLPPDRIRQDVSRSPGGDSRVFLNNCIGCHTGMDPLTQAFAYYNYDETSGAIVYTAGQVQTEVLQQCRQLQARLRHQGRALGQLLAQWATPLLGWDPALPGSGVGAKSMGQELANSDAFAQLPGREGLQGRLLPCAEQCRGPRANPDIIKASSAAATTA
jgi:hypothetical protein